MLGKVERILAIDVGSGTQDILLYESDKTMENCVQMILPSQTQIVGRTVTKATAAHKAIFLTGQVMGGGASTDSIRKHLAAGLSVYSTQSAAYTIRDNLDEVRSMGVRIVDEAPKDAVEIGLADVDLEALESALSIFGVQMPERYAIAVQDHGYSPNQSNRKFRFQHWRHFVEAGGALEDLAYYEPPAYLTRMEAVLNDIPGALVMDTGAAAVWGSLSDPTVAQATGEGVIVVNVGNDHTVAVLLKGRRIWGLFEHHTHGLSAVSLHRFIGMLRQGALTNDEVFEDGGHGCFIHLDYEPKGFDFVTVTGPNRYLARDLGYYFAAPYGDMMLTGCFGLVSAALETGPPPE